MTASGSSSNLSSLRHRVVVEIKPSSSPDLEDGFFTAGPLNCLPAVRKNDCVLLDDRDFISTSSGLVAATSGFFTPIVPSALTLASKNSTKKVVVPTRIPKTLHPSDSAQSRFHGRPSTAKAPEPSSLTAPTTPVSVKSGTESGVDGSQTVVDESFTLTPNPTIQNGVSEAVTQTTTRSTTVKPITTTRKRTRPTFTTISTTTTTTTTKPVRLAHPGPSRLLDRLWVDVGTYSTNSVPLVVTTTQTVTTSTHSTLPTRFTRTTTTTEPPLNGQSEEVDSDDDSGLPHGDAIDQPDTMRRKNDYRMTQTPLFAVRPTTPMGLPMTSSKPYTASGPVADFPRTQLILIASMSLIILIAVVVFWVFCWCQQQSGETKAPTNVAGGYVPIPTDSTPPEMRACVPSRPTIISGGNTLNGGTHQVHAMNGVRSTTHENGFMRNGMQQHGNPMNGNRGIPNGAASMNNIANGFNVAKPRVNGLGAPLLNGSAPERKKDFKEWYV